MPAIRPEPVDTSFEQPAMADTGAADYYKNVIYDTLYHSPISAIYRARELSLANNDEESQMLSAEQANEQYGIEGQLKFDEPVRNDAALIMNQRKHAEMRREYELESGSDGHWARGVAGMGVGMVSSIVDPVNLASMFIPIVGENRLLTGTQRATSLLERGLISPKTLASITGTNPLAYRLGKGAIEGLVGSSLARPFDIIATLQEKGHYEWEDEIKNLAFGAATGAGIHSLLGFVHDRFQAMKQGMVDIDPQTHEAATMTATADLARDEHITSPEKILSVDHNIVASGVREANNDEVFALARDVRDRLTQIQDSGKELLPEQQERLDRLNSLLDNPVYKGYKTANELAELFGLELNPDANRVSEETQAKVESIAEDAKRPDPDKNFDSQQLNQISTEQKLEPVKPHDLESHEELQKQLQEEIGSLTQQMGELEPHEESALKLASDKDVNTVTKSIADGMNCILNKAV